jgi:parvulin-like peptidyl-prolyl isomerase
MYNVEMGKVNVDLTSDQIKAARVQLIYLAANEENKADVKKKMQQIRDGLKTSETSFYVTAKEQTEADEIECLIGNSDSRTNLAKAVVALKKGQTTDVIEESDGFYLAYCIEANAKSVRKEYRNQVVQEKQTKAFQEAYKSWSEKFDVKVSKALLAED